MTLIQEITSQIPALPAEITLHGSPSGGWTLSVSNQASLTFRQVSEGYQYLEEVKALLDQADEEEHEASIQEAEAERKHQEAVFTHMFGSIAR